MKHSLNLAKKAEATINRNELKHKKLFTKVRSFFVNVSRLIEKHSNDHGGDPHVE